LMAALSIPSIPIKKKKRYVSLIFGDGGSRNTVLFPRRCSVVIDSSNVRVIGPLWSIVAAKGGLVIAGKATVVTVPP